MNGTILKQVLVVALVLGTSGMVAWAETPGEELPTDPPKATGVRVVRSRTQEPQNRLRPNHQETAMQSQRPSGRYDMTEDAVDAKLERARVRYINVSNDCPKALEAWEARMSKTVAGLEKLQAEIRSTMREAAEAKAKVLTKNAPTTRPAKGPVHRAEALPKPKARAGIKTATDSGPGVEKTRPNPSAEAIPKANADRLEVRCKHIAAELERLAAQLRAMPQRAK